LSESQIDYTKEPSRTIIYRTTGKSESAIGFVDAQGVIYKLRWGDGIRVGHITPDHRVLRDTRYDERELGSFTLAGNIHSHGLFEGGELGWVETDGVVVRAGLIFGEEEVGRVKGTAKAAAGAALLLLFMVDEQEESNRSNR